MKARLARLARLVEIRDRAVQQAVREVKRTERERDAAREGLTRAQARVDECRLAEIAARHEWLNPSNGHTQGSDLMTGLARLDLLKLRTEEARAAVPPAESALSTAEVAVLTSRDHWPKPNVVYKKCKSCAMPRAANG